MPKGRGYTDYNVKSRGTSGAKVERGRSGPSRPGKGAGTYSVKGRGSSKGAKVERGS